jgi:hypothetical protein
LAGAVPVPNFATPGQSVPDYARPQGPWSLSPAAKGYLLIFKNGHRTFDHLIGRPPWPIQANGTGSVVTQCGVVEIESRMIER